MTQQEQLRAASCDGSLPGVVKPERSKAQPRAEKALPTDRMKFGVQVKTLQAFAMASGFGKHAITTEELAGYVPVTAGTAGLNNAFFYASGLLERESKGRYKPTAVVKQFAREMSFDPVAAGKLLGPTLSRTWYFDAAQSRLAMGPTLKAQMIQCLAHAAGASANHVSHLEGLLEWLRFAGLLTIKDDQVELVADGQAHEVEVALAGDLAATGDAQLPDQSEMSPEAPAPPSGTVLHFSLQLTADDLAKLTTEQITALFAAVGQVMAIKSAAA